MARVVGPGRAAAVLAAAALMVIVTVIPSAAPGVAADRSASGSPADGSPVGNDVTCDYWFLAWSGGFVAEVSIRNNGPAIQGWTVELGFDRPTALGPAWNADMWQPDEHTMSAANLGFNGNIPPGGAVTFGWVAIAATHEVPALRLNGEPC